MTSPNDITRLQDALVAARVDGMTVSAMRAALDHANDRLALLNDGLAGMRHTLRERDRSMAVMRSELDHANRETGRWQSAVAYTALLCLACGMMLGFVIRAIGWQ